MEPFAVFLLSFGTPDDWDDIAEFLHNIRGGRPPRPNWWKRCASATAASGVRP